MQLFLTAKVLHKVMSNLEHNKLDYIVAIISDFAKKFSLTNSQAYRYLNNYNGIDFLDRNYDVEHIYSYDDIVEDVSIFCHNKGGALI